MCECANGTSFLVEAHRVREALGVGGQETGGARRHLGGEGLLHSRADAFGAASGPIGLTHRGVVRVEEAADG
ncbi:hypothetical protein BJP40_28230 [Streptomyces sp. CC53]|nr:hypothetical protein BJP40_28230 [Streptomyces sp. CC53]